jgi:hypothetical protein
MLMNRRALMIAVVLGAGLSAGARAQGLLDQQLGPPAAATAPATQPGAATLKPDAAQAEAPKPGSDIVSPDAVKKVDDDELLNQLLKPGTPPDPDAVKRRLQEMVTRMADTTKLLSDKKDPGEVTQETQRRIVADLDVMIELARQQQQQQSSSSSSQQQPGQQRQPGQPQPGGQKGEGGTQAATSEQLPRGGHADPVTGDMRNRDPANPWGVLPPRDRDQISHGANEEYLSAYKDMIDRYYQALAEMGKTRSH